MLLNNVQIRALYAAATSRRMLKRSWLLDTLTATSGYDINITYDKEVRVEYELLIQVDQFKESVAPELGTVIGVNDQFSAVVIDVDAATGTVNCAVLSEKGKPLMTVTDVWDPGDKDTYQTLKEMLGVNPFTTSLLTAGRTTVGRFIENVVCLQFPTNFKIYPYENSVWDPGKVVKKVTTSLVNKQISIEEYKTFLDYFFFLNHITEIAVPSMTIKSLTTHPDVAKVKAQFIADHQGQMHDPVVIKELEDLLSKLDAQWLGKGTDNPDPSVTFFDGLGSKSYDIHRKKLFLTTGGIPAFKEQTGEFDFIPNSLIEGWTVDSIPSIANEIRKGSYERGRETSKGGAETKLVMRVFQDLQINKEDCGTKRTVEFDFGSTCKIKDFIGRTAQVDGQDIVITEENMKQFDGKVVKIYSPMTCATPYDLCYKCCGQRSRELGAEVLGIQVVKITSQFMNKAMKNMHGTVLKIIQPKLADMFL